MIKGSPENQNKSERVSMRALIKQILSKMKQHWVLKLISLLLAVVLWGGLISEDASLTREKSFSDVPISIINADTLQRNGFIVVKGLDKLSTLKVKAEVPQKLFDIVTPSNYNIRVDLGRISSIGEQSIPILYTTSSTYGTLSWLSQTEIKIEVDEYRTRRRIPVQLEQTGSTPSGYYAPTASIDPPTVVISGPGKLVSNIARCTANFDLSQLQAVSGVQYRAIPFTLFDIHNQAVTSPLISVTSDNVLLDTLLAEQMLYPLKKIPINKSLLVKGSPAKGYVIKSLTLKPESLSVAGGQDWLQTLNGLDIAAPIDISEAKEKLVRSIRINKPQNAVYLEESSVTLVVEIVPATPEAHQ